MSHRELQKLSIVAALLHVTATAPLAQQLSSSEIRQYGEEQAPHAMELFREYLRIPNDAHFPEDLRGVIDWLTVEFQDRGFRTEELATGRIPILLAERTFPNAERTLLVYLQSDGQPVGQNVKFLAALSAMDAAGVTPDFNIKVIVDSEEELGSPNLPAAVERYRDRLTADMLVIFDGPRHPTNLPTLTFGARGIATITLTVYGPRVPQHSGHYGNWAPNPAFRLAQVLASMKDEYGRVTIPGFYDGVVLDDATRAALARVPDDETAIKQQLGIVETDSVGATLQEARQYPSLNIRGMASGWVGEQRRTIVPAFATAEIDVRLVKESDPEHLLGLIRRHIEGLGYYVIDREPTDAERQSRPRIATFTSSISYAAYRTEMDSEIGRWLTDAMLHLFGEEPIKIRTSGGSIPISPFVATLVVPAVTVPTVNPDNNQHSPNENLRLGNFVEGIQVILAILQQPMR
jgi:acetylornithine deacetylase/succinyl-diaminopimelate desuccinylase-like protein